MPRRKRSPKKNVSYWFKKWLHKVRIGLNIKKNSPQKPPPDIIFLTSKEVKASLAMISNPESIAKNTDSSSRPDAVILPPKNRLTNRHRKPKSLRHKFKVIFNRISFGIFRKKHSSHHHSRTNITDDTSIAEAKFQKISELQGAKDKQVLQGHDHDPRHRHHGKHRKKNWFQKMRSYIKRKLNIFRKKRDLNPAFHLDAGEDITKKQSVIVSWKEYCQTYSHFNGYVYCCIPVFLVFLPVGCYNHCIIF